MEAYEDRLNKVKVPEIATPAHLHHTTTVTTTTTSSVPPSIDSSRQSNSSDVREIIQVKGQPGIAGEFFVEQVQSIKPVSSANPPRSPDLTQHDAVVSSEEEYEDDHENLDKDKKPSKVKKVKNKLGNAFRKVFHLDKKDGPHEEPEEHLQHETGNPDDESNTVRMRKEIDLHGHNKDVQEKLESAFATEGLKATRDANMVSQNRYEVPAVVGEFMIANQNTGQSLDLGKLMDIQDHREPDFEKKVETVVKEERRGSQSRENVASGPIRTLKDITQDSGYGSVSSTHKLVAVEGVGAAARATDRKSPEKLPYSIRRAEMDDPILRDMDVGQLAPLRRNSTDRTPIHHGGHHGASEYSHRQHITVHTSPDEHDRLVDQGPHITKFENVEVRSHVGGEGHLVRSSEEWDLAGEASRPRSGTGNATLMKEVEKEGEKFSEKFTTVGEKRGSIGSDGKRGSIGSDGKRGSIGAEGKRGSIGGGDRGGPQLIPGGAYEDRLNLAREKWVAPVEIIKTDKSDVNLMGMSGSVPVRQFERVASDAPLVHEGYTRLNERTSPAHDSTAHDTKVYAFGTYAERAPLPRKSMGDTVLHTDLSSHVLNELADGQARPPLRNDSYVASMNYMMDAPSHLGDVRIAPALGSLPPASVRTLDEVTKGEAFLDAELAGEDLARPKRDISVQPTIPLSVDQPVLEVYDKSDGIPDILASTETTVTKTAIVRETDRAKEIPGEDAELAAQDEKEIREAHEENEDKTVMTKAMESVGSAVESVQHAMGSAVESVEHAVSGMVSSVAGMFTGAHKTDEEAHKTHEETPKQSEEPLPATSVIDYVSDKLFGLYTAGTGALDETPQVEQKDLPVEAKTESESPTPVIPLAVKGEFCEGPIGGVATVPVESVRNSGDPPHNNIALSQARSESKDI